MEILKIHKLLYIVMAIIVVQFLYQLFFQNRDFKDALTGIKEIKKELATSTQNLSEAKHQTDLLQQRLTKYELYIDDIQKSVTLLELDRRLGSKKFTQSKDSIQKIINMLEKQIDTSRTQLPEIKEEF